MPHRNVDVVLFISFTIGGNLFERLSDRMYKLTETKCKTFVRQILEGLEFIHSRRIIHLNIIPYNIIFLNKVCHITKGYKIQIYNYSEQ